MLRVGLAATIGVQRPPNLAIAVFDNGRYGETGMVASHTETAVELTGVARAMGSSRLTSPTRRRSSVCRAGAQR